ncbi:hypothetical protein THICB3180110 [Thiomonas sp. CB3]|nr:hypothetical protein THICB3180110 [Thiomonas sp. CB3]
MAKTDMSECLAAIVQKSERPDRARQTGRRPSSRRAPSQANDVSSPYFLARFQRSSEMDDGMWSRKNTLMLRNSNVGMYTSGQNVNESFQQLNVTDAVAQCLRVY